MINRDVRGPLFEVPHRVASRLHDFLDQAVGVGDGRLRIIHETRLSGGPLPAESLSLLGGERLQCQLLDTLLARLQLQSGRALIELSQYEEALGCCERAHAYFKDHSLMAPLAHAYNCFGRIHFRLGDLDKAKEFYEAALHLFRWDLNDEEGVIRAHNNLGVLYRHLSDWRQATWHLLRSMEISTRLGNFAFISVSCANIGIVHDQLGRRQEAYAAFRKSLALDDEGEMAQTILKRLSRSYLPDTCAP